MVWYGMVWRRVASYGVVWHGCGVALKQLDCNVGEVVGGGCCGNNWCTYGLIKHSLPYQEHALNLISHSLFKLLNWIFFDLKYLEYQDICAPARFALCCTFLWETRVVSSEWGKSTKLTQILETAIFFISYLNKLQEVEFKYKYVLYGNITEQLKKIIWWNIKFRV